eukprot:TRINITY_DN24242_c0_g1_i1.p1 TRINITY_DN24242_c0_g1~~TRINITY_DN24242_c0_g1_i1.p1  ORF type:complete len:239 (+),score=117.23 TRINITY_DN24242_c0_g1_i1:83-718(+)
MAEVCNNVHIINVINESEIPNDIKPDYYITQETHTLGKKAHISRESFPPTSVKRFIHAVAYVVDWETENKIKTREAPNGTKYYSPVGWLSFFGFHDATDFIKDCHNKNKFDKVVKIVVDEKSERRRLEYSMDGWFKETEQVVEQFPLKQLWNCHETMKLQCIKLEKHQRGWLAAKREGQLAKIKQQFLEEFDFRDLDCESGFASDAGYSTP